LVLTDPTGGAGYAFGAKLPSTDMTTIATQQVRAVDGTLGGTYSPTGDLFVDRFRATIQGTHSISDGSATTGGRVPLRYVTTSVDSNQTLRGDSALFDVLFLTGEITVASKTLTIAQTANTVADEFCLVVVDSSAAFALDVNSQGGASNPICTFTASPNADVFRRFTLLRHNDSSNEWEFVAGSTDVSP
jgi:hypothetical protein